MDYVVDVHPVYSGQDLTKEVLGERKRRREGGRVGGREEGRKDMGTYTGYEVKQSIIKTAMMM